MDPEHDAVQVTAEGKVVSMKCGVCEQTGIASWMETDDPRSLAEERLYALSCSNRD